MYVCSMMRFGLSITYELVEQHRCARWVEFLGHPPTSTPKNGIYPHPKIWQVQTLSTPRKCSGVEQSPSASEASAKILLNKIFSKQDLFSKKVVSTHPKNCWV